MNILFLTPQFPFPLNNGGKIGAYNGISVLQNFANVTVLSFCEDEHEIERYENISEKFETVRYEKPIYHMVHIRKKVFKLLGALISSLFRGVPYLVSKFYDKKMLHLIDEQLKNNSYDVVFIDYLNMAIYGDYIKKKCLNMKFVLKDHNVEYELFEQEAKKSSFIKKIVVKWQARLTKKYEVKHIAEADYVFTVCDDNVQKLSRYSTNIKAMKPTFDIKPFRSELHKGKGVLFIGSLSWKQNIDGLQWFFDNVWDKIYNEVPDVVLRIVGSGGDKVKFDKPNVEIMGYVEDLSEVYNMSRVFIVPLLEGSGIRIKILEAFNNDIVVVSTNIGCDTIGAGKNEIVSTDNPDEFACMIIKLLQDDILNNEIRYNAKQFLKKEYSLAERQKEIKEILYKG